MYKQDAIVFGFNKCLLHSWENASQDPADNYMKSVWDNNMLGGERIIFADLPSAQRDKVFLWCKMNLQFLPEHDMLCLHQTFDEKVEAFSRLLKSYKITCVYDSDELFCKHVNAAFGIRTCHINLAKW